ncbi:MAG: 3-dehydroquinate synthase, partial [Opitutia bacterium]
MDDSIDLEFSVTYRHRILFTEDAFRKGNRVLAGLFGGAKVIPMVDSGLAAARPGMLADIQAYGRTEGVNFTRAPLVLTGGEAAKKDSAVVKAALAAIEADKICRHSYVLAVGGGAFLDAVGFAAATAHRGVRLVRMPTTTLGQGDAGVGVKNGINTFGKKNFTGAFAVPSAVVNDLSLLASLDARGLRDGLVEAVKVSLLKDPAFFAALEKDAPALARGDLPAVGRAVRRSAELHARHIAGNGDPFELGSARPLDLGHWAAHKLESMTDHRLTHGEAVAVGLALDLLCARDLGVFAAESAERSLALLSALGFRTYAPEMHLEGGARLLAGLEEFREHLG